MAVDQDILSTLKRMEGLMKSQSAATPAGAGMRAKIAGGGNSRDNDGDTGTSKKGKIYRATAKSIEGVGDAADALNGSFGSLNRTVKMTRANFIAMNRQMRGMGKGTTSSSPNPTLPGNVPVNPLPQTLGGNASQKAQSAAGANATRSANGASSALRRLSGGTVALLPILKGFGDALIAATNDAFFFASRGLDASAGFKGLYMDAIKAGMGVREYTQMLSDNMPAVVRAKSNADFADSLDATRGKLAKLGVFGEEATKLSASLANSSTVIGISQSSIGAAAASQVSIFAELRKTTMMTANQFQALTQELADNSTVQETMQGLNQNMRSARMQEIIQIQTLGLRLGATEKASKALGDAMLAQRNASLKSRFEAQGLARQASAVFGMDSGKAERLSMLSRKKNLSAEEAAEMQGLADTLNSKIQTALNSGNVNQEFMAEEFLTRLDGTNLGKIMSASGAVGLTASSGDIANKDLGKGASTLVEGAGMLLTYATGLSKNPVAMAGVTVLASAAGAVLGAMGFKGLLGILSKAMATVGAFSLKGLNPFKGKTPKPPGGPGASGMVSKVGQGIMSAGSKAAGLLQKAGPVLQSVWKGASSLFSGITAFIGSGLSKVTTFIGGASKLLPAIGAGLKMIPGLGTIGTAIFSSISEIVSGDVNNAFNADGGNWLSRIGNTVFAAITSVFGGIADLVDGVVKFFGGDGFDLRNSFDKFAALMRGGFFSALASVAKVVTLGSDNKLSNYFQEAADSSFSVLDKLSADQTATISSIGAENTAKLESQKKAAKAVNDTVSSVTKAVNASAGIATTTTGLAGSAVEHARALASAAAVPAQSTPVQPPPVKQALTDPTIAPKIDVNTLSSAAQTTTQSSNNTSSTTSGDAMTQLLGLVQELLGLIQAGNTLSESQLQALDVLSRGRSRTASSDNNVLLDQLANKS